MQKRIKAIILTLFLSFSFNLLKPISESSAKKWSVGLGCASGVLAGGLVYHSLKDDFDFEPYSFKAKGGITPVVVGVLSFFGLSWLFFKIFKGFTPEAKYKSAKHIYCKVAKNPLVKCDFTCVQDFLNKMILNCGSEWTLVKAMRRYEGFIKDLNESLNVLKGAYKEVKKNNKLKDFYGKIKKLGKNIKFVSSVIETRMGVIYREPFYQEQLKEYNKHLRKEKKREQKRLEKEKKRSQKMLLQTTKQSAKIANRKIDRNLKKEIHKEKLQHKERKLNSDRPVGGAL